MGETDATARPFLSNQGLRSSPRRALGPSATGIFRGPAGEGSGVCGTGAAGKAARRREAPFPRTPFRASLSIGNITLMWTASGLPTMRPEPALYLLDRPVRTRLAL